MGRLPERVEWKEIGRREGLGDCRTEERKGREREREGGGGGWMNHEVEKNKMSFKYSFLFSHHDLTKSLAPSRNSNK